MISRIKDDKEILINILCILWKINASIILSTEETGTITFIKGKITNTSRGKTEHLNPEGEGDSISRLVTLHNYLVKTSVHLTI